MFPVLVITGPPACGAAAVVEHLARRIPRAVVIDVDDLRRMVAVGRREPWEGEEGQIQQELAVRNACALVRSFRDAGFQPLILDMVTDETAQLYRTLLPPEPTRIVLLLPSLEAVEQRNASREPPFTSEQLRSLYETQRRFSEFDALIDNTSLNPAAVAERIYQDCSAPE